MHTADALSTAEAATVAKVNRSTFTRWVAAGRIKPIVQGPTDNGAMFFDRSDVEALAAERTAGAQ